jgi:hypothetical protein
MVGTLPDLVGGTAGDLHRRLWRWELGLRRPRCSAGQTDTLWTGNGTIEALTVPVVLTKSE